MISKKSQNKENTNEWKDRKNKNKKIKNASPRKAVYSFVRKKKSVKEKSNDRKRRQHHVACLKKTRDQQTMICEDERENRAITPEIRCYHSQTQAMKQAQMTTQV